MDKVRPLTWVGFAFAVGGLVMTALQLPLGPWIVLAGLVLNAIAILTAR